MRRTQVAIIGGGPAGILLSHLLHLHEIDSVVLERQTKAYVLKRIRAGVLEYGSVKLLRDVGRGRDGWTAKATHMTAAGSSGRTASRFSSTPRPTPASRCVSHGQTAITEELYRIRERDGGRIVEEAENVRLHDLTHAAPKVTYDKGGVTETLECDFIAGCDGFHGVSRQSIPKETLRIFERAYPFGWLGIMSETPPVGDVIYARHERGFALASLRNPRLSRYYIQCGLDTEIADWPDDRFWDELKRRFPDDIGRKIVTGPSIEKSIAPLAQLRRRADALRPAFSRRRRRPYRPADRGEGLEPRDLGRLLSPARPRRAFRQRRRPLSRTLFGHGAETRLGGGALFLVADQALARLSR